MLFPKSCSKTTLSKRIHDYKRKHTGIVTVGWALLYAVSLITFTSARELGSLSHTL